MQSLEPGCRCHVSPPWQFIFEESSGADHRGRFIGEVEISGGIFGDAAGTFRLRIPRGLEGGEPHHILDTATLEVTIESVPGW